VIEVIAFHACKQNGQEHDAPFLSRSNNQWLTQGYYFWTDSDYFAKKWSEDCYKARGYKYCIMKFELSFEKNKLFDLVGNVDHKIKFYEMVKKLKKLNIISKDSLSLRAVVEYLRELNSPNPKIEIKKTQKPQLV